MTVSLELISIYHLYSLFITKIIMIVCRSLQLDPAYHYNQSLVFYHLGNDILISCIQSGQCFVALSELYHRRTPVITSRDETRQYCSLEIFVGFLCRITFSRYHIGEVVASIVTYLCISLLNHLSQTSALLPVS